MKKTTLNKKLNLKKEVIVNLDQVDMVTVYGGTNPDTKADATDLGYSCVTSTCCRTYNCPTDGC